MHTDAGILNSCSPAAHWAANAPGDCGTNLPEYGTDGGKAGAS